MGDITRLTDTFKEQTSFDEKSLTDIGIELITRSRMIANVSDHHRYHVGSSLLSITSKGKYNFSDNANKIPDTLKDQGYTSYNTIGDGSPTVHGEFPLLYDTPPSEHLFLGCNTPNCATCLKSAIMRDVDALFIDAESLPGIKGTNDKENPWTQDRADFWNDLCIPIARAAQIPIYAINMQSETLSILVSGKPPQERPQTQNIARVLDENEIGALEHNPDLFMSQARGVRSVIGVAKDKKTDQEMFIYAQDSLPPGFSEQLGNSMTKGFEGSHYHFPLDPIIHMMMVASKHHLELQNGKILTNFVPSSGRQLDLAQIGLSDMFITNHHIPPSPESRKAMKELSDAGLIEYSKVKPKKAIAEIMQSNSREKNNHTQYNIEG